MLVECQGEGYPSSKVNEKVHLLVNGGFICIQTQSSWNL
jgi:hypothetical protein